jgi:ribonuclease HII
MEMGELAHDDSITQDRCWQNIVIIAIECQYGVLNIMKSLSKFSVGIDEVGRGPIAGPVAVGAFIFLNNGARKLFRGVKESKQLSEKQREEWYEKILQIQKAGHVDFCVSFQSEKIIDSKGLSWAIKKALSDSLGKVMKNERYLQNDRNVRNDRCAQLTPNSVKVLLDGGLRAPVEFTDQKTIIKGDEKEMVIALASICAKVLRDRKMNKLGVKYPQYGFVAHKGYGTKKHYEAIGKYGMLGEHRRSFLKSLTMLSK